jgi:sugar-specific transcriptional regulator TrmB
LELGFTEYEAKVYIALLAHSPATAYETAKSCGVPTSKIYEVLERLSARTLVISYNEGDRKLYAPKGAQEFIADERSRLSDTLQKLADELSDISQNKDVSYLWNIKNRAALIEKAIAIIGRSKKELLLSAAAEELDEIGAAVDEAAARGVKLATVRFGLWTGKTPGICFDHPIQDTLQNEKGGRGFALVADSSEALIGTISLNGKVEGAYSRNKGFVTLAEDYIKHDVYIMKIVNRYDEELIRRFGSKYRRLRDVFTDTEE